MNKNIICPYYCHSQEICCICCLYSIPIEEILTWIVICSLIVFLYNTIKLCIIIFLILSIIYWIYTQTDLPRLLKEFFEKEFHSSVNSRSSNDDNQQLNTPVNENDNDQPIPSTKSSLSNSNIDIDTTSNNDFTKADSNCDDMIIKTIKKSKRNLNERKSSRPSTTKKLLIDNTQISSENSMFNNSISSIDYDKPIRTVNTSEQMIIDPGNSLDTSESNLSLEEQTILKLATENLIQAIISNRINKLNEKKQVSSASIFNNDHRQLKQSSISDIIPNEIDNSIQHPKCVPVQPSFAMNFRMPRVPTKSNVIAIDENDEKSYDDYINTSKHIITTNEQFESIHTKNEQNLENTLLLKDSIAYNNEQPDWAYYSSKPDLFPNAVHSDLPIVQSEDQHLSFKQTIFSYFHRRPKFTPINHLATLHSSSLNANNYIKSFESNLIIQEQRIVQKLLNNKPSFNYISNKKLNHLKQRIFRVRKSRIIISFDDIQQQKDADDNDKKNFNTLVNNFVQNISTEINDARSQLIINNELQTKVCLSAIHEGELLIHNDISIDQNSGENDDPLLEISNSLYSVTSQLILI